MTAINAPISSNNATAIQSHISSPFPSARVPSNDVAKRRCEDQIAGAGIQRFDDVLLMRETADSFLIDERKLRAAVVAAVCVGIALPQHAR